MMRGLWLENQRLRLRDDLPQPDAGRGEAVVRLRLAGVCATDLEMLKGYYPFTGVPGHEFVGEVVQAPDGEAPSLVGQRVVGEINVSCGECEACRRGRRTHCERRTVLGISNRDGVFAEYFSLPVENLHPVPDSVPDEAAVFVEPLAAALEIQEQVHILPDDRVLVVGAGRLGQLIAQTLALTGCDLQVVARHPEQRRMLVERGIHTLAEDQAPDGWFDIVVEATGSPAGFAQARRSVRKRGTIVMKSTYKGDITLNLSSIVVDEISLVGSRCGPFPPALRLLEQKLVDPTPLIMGCYRLVDGLQAMDRAAQSGVMKVLIEP